MGRCWKKVKGSMDWGKSTANRRVRSLPLTLERDERALKDIRQRLKEKGGGLKTREIGLGVQAVSLGIKGMVKGTTKEELVQGLQDTVGKVALLRVGELRPNRDNILAATVVAIAQGSGGTAGQSQRARRHGYVQGGEEGGGKEVL